MFGSMCLYNGDPVKFAGDGMRKIEWLSFMVGIG
jgi:hypothetical protein